MLSACAPLPAITAPPALSLLTSAPSPPPAQALYSPNGQATDPPQYYLSCKAFFELKNGNTQTGTGKFLEWLMFSFMQTCSRKSPGEYAIDPKDRTIL